MTTSEGPTCIVNGKLCRIEHNETVGSLRRKAGVGADESLVSVSHASADACDDSARVVQGGKYRSIPPTTQG
jgi:hypothetical protein